MGVIQNESTATIKTRVSKWRLQRERDTKVVGAKVTVLCQCHARKVEPAKKTMFANLDRCAFTCVTPRVKLECQFMMTPQSSPPQLWAIELQFLHVGVLAECGYRSKKTEIGKGLREDLSISPRFQVLFPDKATHFEDCCARVVFEPNFAVSDTDAPVDRSQRNAVCRGKGRNRKRH